MTACTIRAALLGLTALLFLTACQGPAAPTAEAAPPWVKTVPIEAAAPGERQFSGTLRARHETPLALQVGGRVLTRPVQAGQPVSAGQTLLTLDAHDLQANEASAEAQLASAEAAQRHAERELERQRQLVAQGFVSAQTLERFELALREAAARVQAARSQMAVARNLRQHTQLRAPAAGVLLELSAEPGQVLAAGQSVGTLAHAGEREIELFLPQGLNAPRTGHAVLPDGVRQPLQLREVAGAADPLSRTWRARYRIVGALDPAAWPLGAVVRVALQPEGHAATTEAALQRVPLGALDERGGGAQLWRVAAGRAQPVPVRVHRIDATHAHVSSPLANGEAVVALGTHRLSPGLAVRELPR